MDAPLPILIAPVWLLPIPILIVPTEVVAVPMLICPFVESVPATFVPKLKLEVVVDVLMVFVVSVALTLVFPEMSKLNAGFSVFIPTKPDPPAAYSEILSAVAAAIGSFSTPIVKRPALVAAPDKSWYFM